MEGVSSVASQVWPVVSFYIGSKPVISLGTAKAAWDLLERRGEIYSNRPRSIMMGEIVGGGNMGISMSYDQRFKNWRSLMHAGMNPTMALKYRPMQSLESFLLLRDLMQNPGEYRSYVTRFAMSVVFCVGYGRRVKTLQDDVVVATAKADGYIGKVAVPGKYLVESWPILLWIPKPLQWFRWEPERYRALYSNLYVSLMNIVKQQMEDGTARESMATHALGKQEQFGMTDIQTAYALSAPWAAGIGTTVITIDVFFMAMLHYPEVMKKAQAEIDAVIGSSRIPEFGDEGSLPYLQAVLKETMRWFAIAPTGFAHAVERDDVYEGMFIPKGSTVYGNIYTIMRDPEMFPEPDVFKPERFMDNPDPRFANFNIAFGFGRRICPGMHVASQSLFIAISRILWAFDVTPVNDDNGKPILPDRDVGTTGLITRPLPFPLSLVPRNNDVAEMITREADTAEEQLKSWS